MGAPGTEGLRAVVCLKETEKALLVDDGEEKVWVPKSVITEASEVQGEGDEGVLEVEAWFARKLGWD